jgi:hypothetical protein
MTTKVCRACGLEKPLHDFYFNAADGRHQNPCKACANARRVSQKQRLSTEARRDREYRHRYGITLADYDRMLAAQGGCCAICGTDAPTFGKGHFSVDHDHATGAVRGLLCDNCNTGIGKLRDDPAILRAALVYLESPR